MSKRCPEYLMEKMQGIGYGAQCSFNQRHQEAFLSLQGVLNAFAFSDLF